MRFNPTKLLHGLLYSTPVILLTLAACGGGGGSTPTTTPLAAAYTLGGAASGVSSTGLKLQNNGGDDLLVASGATSYAFSHSVIAGDNYNITVLTHPSSPPQKCTVTAASGVMPSYNVINANVSCVPAYTIGGTITGATLATGLVLQNNGGDNYLVPAGAITFEFSSPLAEGDPYNVTVLTQPHNPAQTCTTTGAPNPASGVVATTSISTTIDCVASAGLPPADQFVYTANYGDATVSALLSTSGTLSTNNTRSAETNPSSIVVDPAGLHVYETNFGANNIRVYGIDSLGALSVHIDADGSIINNQDAIATGAGPIAISIHPSGKFAYAVNQISNSVSGYSIDPVSGALSRMDMNGSAVGTTIPTRRSPLSIAITPDGGYAYVANADEADATICLTALGCGSVSAYRIDATTGVFTAITDPATNKTYVDAGQTLFSITVDPTGQYAYVANGAGFYGSAGNGDVWVYSIDPGNGQLSHTAAPVTAGDTPRAVTTDPSGTHAYVVNGGSNDISAYSIDSTNGALTQINCNGVGGSAVCSSPNTANFLAGTGPISISIDSSGQYAYIANSVDSTVSAYSIDGLGALIPVAGGTIATGANPHAITTAR